MRPVLRRALLVPALALLAAPAAPPPDDGEAPPPAAPPRSVKAVHAGAFPSDWFLRQRAWPHPDVRPEAVRAAWAEARALREAAELSRDAVAWEPVGPVNIGGRIADVACHPTDPATVWLGTASGGVFRTTDGGATWTPQFDDESSLSIGAVAVAPSDPDVVWVGTGEPNGGGGSVTYGGTGVFRSTNGGATWTHRGLEATRYVGRVVVHPTDPGRVWVAALGAMFSTSPERGVYRTTDDGATWDHVLAIDDSTGAIDLVIDPTDPDRLWTATWERRRGPDYLAYGGDGSGVWRTTDGGDTWAELTNGLPAGPDVGRIGLAIAESSPSILYAVYADADPGYFDGVYRTTNGGDSWTRTNDGALYDVFASYGWWFGNIRVDPADPDRVFVLGLDYWRSVDGGAAWLEAGGSMHVDHHGQDWAADGSIWEGNDGGVYRSTNGGSVWSFFANLPVTQFYTVEVDDQAPHRRYGGTQDNGTNRTLTGAPDDWSQLFGGDGFHVQVDPVNAQYVYVEYQYGNLYRSTNGGASFSWAGSGLSGRKNWSMPYVMDPNTPSTLYAGTDKVHRSTNRAASWTAISPDLTDGPGGGNVTYGTLTTVAVAPSDPASLLAGSDDGRVHWSTNGGASWVPVDAALPDRWVTRVGFDPVDAAVGYVTLSGFRWDEPVPHVFRTTDRGATWTDVSGNLPEAPVNDLVVDPEDVATLFVATDFGVYRTADLGGAWAALGTGLPNGVVTDLELHAGTRVLTAATYGRSLWTLDLDAAAVDAPGPVVASRVAPSLAPPRPNPAPAGRATLRFALPRAADVSLRLYDVAGRRIATLAEGPRGAGDHAVAWDGRAADGSRVAAGVVLVRLEADGVVRTRRLVVTR